MKTKTQTTTVATTSIRKTKNVSTDDTQRARILKVAAELFADRGYNGVGMTELGDAVGLGRGALYHHITCKEQLLYDITRQYMADLVEFARRPANLQKDPIERLKTLGCHLMETILSHKSELTVCFREINSLTGERKEELRRLHAEYENAWRATMVDGENTGLFVPFSSLRLKGILGMYFYSYIWIKPNGRQSAKQIAEVFNSAALAALTMSTE